MSLIYEAKEILSKEFNLKSDSFKIINSKRFKILVERNERYDFINKIKKINGFVYDRNMKGSSIGGFKYKDISIFIKPINVQGRSSSGLKNEDILEDTIKQYLKSNNKIDVCIRSQLNDITVKNVINAKGVGTLTKKYKKTDIILERDEGKNFNISLKKDNAEFWESCDSRYRDVVKKFADKIKSGEHPEVYFKLLNGKNNIYKMHNKVNDKLISGAISRVEDVDEVRDIVFAGREVDAVISRTFMPDDFIFDKSKNLLTIDVTEIIKDTKDLIKFDKWPVLKIRHDSTRDKTYGLRPVMQFSKTASKGSVIEIK